MAQIMRVVIKNMKSIRLLFISMILSVQLCASALGDSERFGWMDSSMGSLGSLFGCIEVPVFAGIHQSSQALNLDDTGQWRSTGIRVEEDKLLQIEWLTKGVLPRPNRYKVMYRIDPRFSMPQIFIQKFDIETGEFVSDFHQFKGGQLLRYQDVPEMTFEQRIIDYTDYFKFNGRSKIPVKINDVVNITLDKNSSFYSSSLGTGGELGIGSELLSVYTKTSVPSNRIFYSNPIQFCKDAIEVTHPNQVTNCQTFDDLYWDTGINWDTYLGKIENTGISATKWANMPACLDNTTGMNNDPICHYDLGRGMAVSVGGTTVKSETQKFSHSPFTGKDFFYYKSDVEGDLEFKSPWDIVGMYNGGDQLMENWAGLPDSPDYDSFNAYMTALKPSQSMNFLYMGRYMMEIEIGNSVNTVNKEDLKAIKVEYYISDTAIPNSGTTGVSIAQDFRGNADASGFLWLRVIRPNAEMSGTIQVRTANYTGSTWFSDVVYNKLVKPLRDKFNELSEVIYRKLVSNVALQNIAKAMLIIYIIIYGLTFLAGATQITTTDIVVRVLKIGVVVALFSETSWRFFNQNLFNVFVEGTEYLMTTVIGVTSSTGNIFGFIDPIIEKYTNGTVWGLLFIQLLQIHNGLTFFAMMTIYSILIFFRAVLQVIVGYCLAFLGLAVMISLAPFFIILILFERTKSMFDNWISTMFSYMIQPTILLIFFLLIDQIMGEIITRTVVRACWDILIPIRIGLDLNHMSIPISFSFTLPFLPGIPFFVPEVRDIGTIDDFFLAPGTFSMLATSSFLFFALCKLAEGLVDYVTLVVQYLTNVLASRQDGKLQKGMNPIKDITGDLGKLASPVTGAAKGVGRFAKEKLIDQKISRKAGSSDGGDVDYGAIKKPNAADPSKAKEASNIGKKKTGDGAEGKRGDTKRNAWKAAKKPGQGGSGGAGASGAASAATGSAAQSSANGEGAAKASSSKKAPAMGAHRKGLATASSAAQMAASKGGSAAKLAARSGDGAAKANLGGAAAVGANAFSTGAQGGETQSGSGVQRQDFTAPKSHETSDGTGSGFANSSVGSESQGPASTGAREEADRKPDPTPDNEPAQRAKVDNEHEPSENRDSAKGDQPTAERGSSRKLTGDHD